MANIVDHPLIEHKLTQLRCKTSNTKNFRANLNEIAGLGDAWDRLFGTR